MIKVFYPLLVSSVNGNFATDLEITLIKTTIIPFIILALRSWRKSKLSIIVFVIPSTIKT